MACCAVAAMQAAAAPFAYIPNSGDDTVSVIDTASNTVVATVAVGGHPTAVAVLPDGSRVYIANTDDDTVSVIAAPSHVVIATIAVGPAPVSVVAAPDGGRVYVGNHGRSGPGERSVSVIDVAGNTVVDTILRPSVSSVAITPNGTRLYVAGGFDESAVIDTSTHAVIATYFDGGTGPSFASPNGAYIYVVDDDQHGVRAISTNTNTAVAIAYLGNYQGIGDGPGAVAIPRDSTRIFVTNNTTDPALPDSVWVFDAGNYAHIATLPAGFAPQGLAFAPGDDFLYVANYFGDNVSVIDVDSGTLVTSIPVGDGPYAYGDFIGPEPPLCQGMAPTTGCTVNGVANQSCLGTDGGDWIIGTQRADVIVGLGSNDTLQGGNGNDLVCGGAGNDLLHGDNGGDLLSGGAGDDDLWGMKGDDVLDGGSSSDHCTGGAGDDVTAGCEDVVP
jgi:YVTN family beta-propeller protein